MWTRVSGLLRAGAFGVGSDGGGAGPEDEAVVDHEDLLIVDAASHRDHI